MRRKLLRYQATGEIKKGQSQFIKSDRHPFDKNCIRDLTLVLYQIVFDKRHLCDARTLQNK